jgi:sialate O-acetylesterase
MIRMFHVARAQSASPLEDCTGAWRLVSPQTIAGFSAVAYSFGRELYKALNVPVGLIESAWGGTEAELWTSEKALRAMPDFAATIDDMPRRRAEHASAVADWAQRLRSADAPWSAFTGDAAVHDGWIEIATDGQWQGTALAGFDGVAWIRAKVDVPPDAMLMPATLRLGRVDDADATHVNGVLVGESGSVDVERAYKIPAGVLRAGENTIAIRVLDTGGEGGIRHSLAKLEVGDRKIALREFRYKSVLPMSSIPPRPSSNLRSSSTLYNAMIAPLARYRVRGAIWYQGESNVERAYQYRSLFPAMIADWRKAWGYDFPFYFVQIAPFEYGNGDAPAAELREAQLMTLAVRHTGMVVTTDLVDNLRDIHPKNKSDVGARLALIALARLHGQPAEYSGPIYKSHRVEGASIRVTFEHAVGLTSSAPLTEFEIAGVDKVFVPAAARIEGATVVVSSSRVSNPVAGRFAWRRAPQPNLANAAGLPASPFRTDDWPCVTLPAKW